MSWFIAVLSLVCGLISNVQCHCHCYEPKWHRCIGPTSCVFIIRHTGRHDITWSRHSRWRIAIANSFLEPVLVSTVLIVLIILRTPNAHVGWHVCTQRWAPVNHLRAEQRLRCSDVNVLGSLGHKCRVTAVACTLELSTNICPEKAPTRLLTTSTSPFSSLNGLLVIINQECIKTLC